MQANSDESGRLPSNQFDQLIEAVRGGCSDAVGEMLQDCRDYLLLIAGQELESAIGPKVGASDLVQETMLSAQKCIGEFHGKNRDEMLAWLRGILLNDIKETRRRFRTAARNVGQERVLAGDSGTRETDQVPSAEPTPATDAIAREETKLLRRALDRLSREHREVIQLRNWQQLSFADIGRRIGRSSDAARKMWSRAVVRLQDELEHGCE